MSIVTTDQVALHATCRVTERATLLVFADDWGRHPSSCQHLIKRLLHTHDVIWVNTISMRPPRLNLSTAVRAAEKLGQWLTPRRQHPVERGSSPTVVNPWMWPWIRSPWQRQLNQRLLHRQLLPILNRQSGPIYAVTTIPIVEGLIGVLPVQRWTYYCVDDFSVWPGLDGGAIREMESRLLADCDDIVAASTVLQDRAQSLGREASLLTHGVDLEHWSAQPSSTVSRAKDDSPRILFFGLIDERLDGEWLRQLDSALFTGSITLQGPCQTAPDLRNTTRVTMAPAVRYQDLPREAARADVLIMPYIDAAVTRAMQPLKLLEYLATGKPVVVRDLPANREWADALDLASTAEEFCSLVRLRLQTGLPENQRLARARLIHQSWESKAQLLEQTIVGNSVDA